MVQNLMDTEVVLKAVDIFNGVILAIINGRNKLAQSFCRLVACFVYSRIHINSSDVP